MPNNFFKKLPTVLVPIIFTVNGKLGTVSKIFAKPLKELEIGGRIKNIQAIVLSNQYQYQNKNIWYDIGKFGDSSQGWLDGFLFYELLHRDVEERSILFWIASL